MDTTTVREQQDSQSLPEAGSSLSRDLLAGDFPEGTVTAIFLKLDQFRRELEELKQEIPAAPEKLDTAVCEEQDSLLSREMMAEEEAVILQVLNFARESEELDARMEERKQQEENLTCRIKKLKKDIKRVDELHSRFNKFLEEEYFNPWAEKAENARQEGLQKEAEIRRLKEETARLVERKQELQHQIKLHTMYRDVMEQAAKRGGFESAEHLADHIMRLIHLRDKLIQLENDKLDKIDQLKKQQVTMEDHHRVFMLQKHNRLAELDTELEETRAEKLTWEKRWNHIQETATKKTLELGQIKMATLSLYEMTGDTEVDVGDTEKQLDKIKQFIIDHDDIVKRYQAEQGEEQQRKGQNKGKGKKRNPPKRR